MKKKVKTEKTTTEHTAKLNKINIMKKQYTQSTKKKQQKQKVVINKTKQKEKRMIS